MSQKLQAVRGMNDILPEEAEQWQWFEATVSRCLQAYGYSPIRLPVVEHTALFKRAIGEVTDIVEKEMYAFTDALNGEELTLRPEGTAGCVRAAIEHNLLAQGASHRLWYSGPMFRHERPQKGRYRQFHQIGVEALGLAGPDIDAELILIGARLWQVLGIADNVALELNSLGDAEARAAHRSALVDYFTAHRDALDEDSLRRLERNPLRILDTKNPQMQALVEAAPKLTDYLDDASRAHFDGLTRLLDVAGVRWRLNPRLVRGLDYYNRTVFEWVTTRLGAQGTVCAGGRYDGLVAQLGGKPAPAAGFAMGVERLLALCAEARQPVRAAPQIYVIHQGETALPHALRCAELARDQGCTALMTMGEAGFKAQFRKANASGAWLALIVGDDEAQAGAVSVKFLRDEGREQCRVSLDALRELLAAEFADASQL